MRNVILAGLVVAGLATGGANAATVVQNLTIQASGFTLQFGDGSVLPVEPVVLDFSVSFDNAASFGGTTSGLTVNSFNLPYALQYAYFAGTDVLTVATNAGISSCNNPASSFCTFISGISTTPTVSFLQQSTPTGGFWVAQTTSITSGSGAVPEPATWAMLITGFGLVGASMRRRRLATV